MERLKALARHPLFLAGLVLRLVLVVAILPWATDHWYAPFLAGSIHHASADPWTAHLERGGDPLAFPYGYAMWLAFLPLASVFASLGAPVAYAYGATLLAADVAMLATLRRLTTSTDRLLLSLYWLSPIVLYATYWQGFNDLLPVLMLMFALRALRDKAPRLAGVWAALAVSAKLSMIIAAPLVLIYLYRNKKVRVFFAPFLQAGTLALAILLIPYVLSRGGREMLFGNPELAKVYELSVQMNGELRVYVLPLAYVLVLASVWHLRRMSFELLLALLGLAFFLVLLLSPAAAGWFVWVLPFLVLYQLKSDRIAVTLVGAFSALYLGLALLPAHLPTSPVFGWATAGAKPVDLLLLSPHLLSLWQTLLLATGLTLAARMVREGIQTNEFFRLSRKPFVIGIAGDSGTGKDTLADGIAGLFGSHSVAHLSGDDYHLWDRQKPMWQAITHVNPRANDLTRLTHDVHALSAGRPVYTRQYDHVSGKMSQPVWTKSNDFVVVCGLHALYSPLLRDVYDLTIYLEMDEALRRYLKMQRDVGLRGQSREQVLASIERRADDAARFIAPQAQQASLVLSLQATNPEALHRSDVLLRLKLSARAREGMYYEDLVRVLIGVCGLHVDIAQDHSDAPVELTVEGDIGRDDVALAARELLPNLEELLDLSPEWLDGARGIAQLIVLTHVSQALRAHLV